MSTLCGCAVEVPGDSPVADWPSGGLYLVHVTPPRAAEQFLRRSLGLDADAIARVVSMVRRETFERLAIPQGELAGPL